MSFRMRILSRAPREEGFAIVAALCVLAVVLLLATAGLSATISTTSVATHGTSNAAALAAADDAADMGWNRMNLVKIDSLGLSASAPCLSWDLSGNVTAVAALTFGTTKWCPSVAVAVPGASAASFQVSQLVSGNRYLVGSATVRGVTRRVEIVLNQTGAASALFDGYGLLSHASLDFVNQTLVSGVGVRSDGSIKLEDTAVPCHVPNGSITPGPGQSVTTTNNAGKCGQSTTASSTSIVFPPVTVPTTNDDSRICATGKDTCTSGSNSVSWNGTTQVLTLQNTGDQVTLKGNTYVFCQLNVVNGTLLVQPTNGQPVSIYLQSPSVCLSQGVNVGTQDLTVQNTSAWIKNGTTLGAAGLQIYMAGAETGYINNSSSTPINATIYAPNGTISMINSAQVKGAVMANAVTMTANATLTYDSTAANVTGATGAVVYKTSQYLECPATPGSGQAPDNGCP
jgi:hypothetical protein